VIVTVLIVGIVSLSALLVRASFQVDAIRGSLTAMRAEHEELATAVVTLSSPSRIAEWARERGMVHAADVTVLRVRPGSSA
jgi:cell division protein FtsL